MKERFLFREATKVNNKGYEKNPKNIIKWSISAQDAISLRNILGKIRGKRFLFKQKFPFWKEKVVKLDRKFYPTECLCKFFKVSFDQRATLKNCNEISRMWHFERLPAHRPWRRWQSLKESGKKRRKILDSLFLRHNSR